MGVIQTKAKSIDRDSLTFKMFGAGGVAFVNAVKKLITENTPSPETGLTANEVQEWIEDDVDSTRRELLNNNTNTRWNNPNEGAPLYAVTWNIIPWTTDNFTAGGIRPHVHGLYGWEATCNKCGCYSVYCELEIEMITGTIDDPKIAIFRTRPDGSYTQWFANNLDALFGAVGGSFTLRGSDLVYMDCGDSIDIRIWNGNATPVQAFDFSWDGYVAISYQGNQY